LNGTSALFSSTVQSVGVLSSGNTGATTGQIIVESGANAASRRWKLLTSQNVNGDFVIQQSTTQTGSTFADILGFNATGAATFSSTVAATELYLSTSNGLVGNINSSNANGGYITWQTSGTTIADIGTAQQIFGTGGNDTFGINGRGARALTFGTNNTERMRITSGGNVGIGTTSPGSTRLAVRGSSGGTDAGESLISATLGNDSSMSTALVTIRNAGNRGNIGNADGSSLFRAEFTDATAMIINKDGNVGIGTASPTTKLHVIGSALFNNSSFGTASIRLLGVGASTGLDILADSNDGYLWNRDSGNLYFGTSNAERLRIAANGFVRLSSSSGGLQFNGDTAAANALNDYEEGTWTPNDASGAGLSLTVVDGRYTKIGRQVQCFASITYPSTANANNAIIGGLPFTSSNTAGGSYGAFIVYSNLGTNVFFLNIRNTTTTEITSISGANITNATVSAKNFRLIWIYEV
jgi:hypothetical protein